MLQYVQVHFTFGKKDFSVSKTFDADGHIVEQILTLGLKVLASTTVFVMKSTTAPLLLI